MHVRTICCSQITIQRAIGLKGFLRGPYHLNFSLCPQYKSWLSLQTSQKNTECVDYFLENLSAYLIRFYILDNDVYPKVK